jgi:hypothetical protein
MAMEDSGAFYGSHERSLDPDLNKQLPLKCSPKLGRVCVHPITHNDQSETNLNKGVNALIEHQDQL